MAPLKRLIREVHRRSLWQVVGIYLAGSWVAMQVVREVTLTLGLPDWFPPFAFALLVIGFPIVVATAFVQEGGPDPGGGDQHLFDGAGHEIQRRQSATEGKGPVRSLLTWRNAVTTGVLGFALWGVVAAGWVLLDGTLGQGASGPDSPADETKAALAVLPFDNMSRAEEDLYFTDGMHEEILTQLARIGDLKVISRTSVMEYRETNKNVREIADELGVGYVLEGGVRRSADRVRITAQLIDAKADEHLWAESFDRTLDDVFAIQTEVARRIASSLDARLSVQVESRLAARPTGSLEAYDHYLRGRAFETRSSRDLDLLPALRAYERAVEIDPDFALAHARVGIVHLLLYWYEWDPTDERQSKARAAIDRALDLDPDLPEAHMALGQYFYQGLYNTERGPRYQRALEELEWAEQGGVGDPSWLHLVRAAIHRRQGNFQASVDDFRVALELDPRSATVALNLALTYMPLHEWELAERYVDRAMVLAPHWGALHADKAWIQIFRSGDVAAARRILRESEGRVSEDELPSILGERCQIEWLGRNPEEALKLAERIDGPWAGPMPTGLLLGESLYQMGDVERARVHFDAARRALEARGRRFPREPADRWLAWIHARLGDHEEAVRRADEVVGALGPEIDAHSGDHNLWIQAAVYAMVGRKDEAMDRLERLLSIPSEYRRPFLRLHPVLDPLRDHPRFQELLQEGDASGT